MRAAILSIPFLAAAMTWASCAGAAVTVTFVDAASFHDAAFHSDAQPEEAVLKGIEKHLQHLCERYLRADQQLRVEILDIDLAGRLEPWHVQNYGVRYMRDVTWPRIKLRYVLEHDGKTLESAEESVADLNYLGHSSTYFSSDRLRYEKSMLDDWFRARFVEHRPAR